LATVSFVFAAGGAVPVAFSAVSTFGLFELGVGELAGFASSDAGLASSDLAATSDWAATSDLAATSGTGPAG
jgi:hypothetical protein